MNPSSLAETLLSVDGSVLTVWIEVKNYLSHHRQVDGFLYELSILCMTVSSITTTIELMLYYMFKYKIRFLDILFKSFLCVVFYSLIPSVLKHIHVHISGVQY